MFIKVDHTNNQVTLKVPDKFKEFENEILNDLYEEFAYDLINANTVERMNEFVKNWFEKKGIEIS